jgi:hypothetical protein
VCGANWTGQLPGRGSPERGDRASGGDLACRRRMVWHGIGQVFYMDPLHADVGVGRRMDCLSCGRGRRRALERWARARSI